MKGPMAADANLISLGLLHTRPFWEWLKLSKENKGYSLNPSYPFCMEGPWFLTMAPH